MNKNELIRAVANKAKITLKVAGDSVDALTEAIFEALKNGDKIQLSGFGSFEVKKKPARKGVNPATGAQINIPASNQPVFKFSKTFKDELNK
ncbi:MAG: HU family DNA-binding protein [Clostridiales bacterium]|nr:HU family DNA-binding protein [Clostridiales bacterium]